MLVKNQLSWPNPIESPWNPMSSPYENAGRIIIFLRFSYGFPQPGCFFFNQAPAGAFLFKLWKLMARTHRKISESGRKLVLKPGNMRCSASPVYIFKSSGWDSINASDLFDWWWFQILYIVSIDRYIYIYMKYIYINYVHIMYIWHIIVYT